MSLKDIRSECSQWAALLQPYVDAELTGDDEERVAEHLGECAPCRTAVQEQMWVRTTLRAVEREAAPAALRAKVLLALDEAERQDAPAPAPVPSLWTRVVSRAKDLARGGLILVPAGAVAAGLFFMAKQGVEPAPLPNAGLAAALPPTHATAPDTEAQDVLAALAEVEPQVGFPIQVARPEASQDVELVGARLDRPRAGTAEHPGARLRYRVLRRGEPTQHHVIDQQLPAELHTPRGTPVTFGGQRYLLERGPDGAPVLHFERHGVAHMLRLEGVRAESSAAADSGALPPEFAILFHFAASNLPGDASTPSSPPAR